MSYHGPPTRNGMNKRRFVSFAALAAILCLPCVATIPRECTVILANATITSADQFIDQYCGTYVTTIAPDGSSMRQFSWYTQVDAYNAPLVLESFSVFGQLSPSIQQTIVATCLAHNIDYYSLVGQAQAFLNPAPVAEIPTPVETASQDEIPTEQTPPSSAPVGVLPEESTPKENAASSSEVTSNSQNGGASLANSSSQESLEEPTPPAPIATPEDPAQSLIDQKTLNSTNQISLETDQSQKEQDDSSQSDALSSEVQEVGLETTPILSQTNTASLDSTVPSSEAVQASGSSQSSSTQRQQDAQATQFLNRYCYQSGMLIRQASQTNYRQLLNAINDWLNLSEGSKAAVNSFLTSMGSQTFQTLYVQANRIRLGLPLTQVPAGNSTSVNTAVGQDPTLWWSGLWFSAQGMVYLSNYRRLRVRIEKLKG